MMMKTCVLCTFVSQGGVGGSVSSHSGTSFVCDG